MATLFYIHDPMCSWCYGFGPTLTRLRESLPSDLNYVRLLGGLAPDTEEAMPAEMQLSIRSNWERIQQHIPGTRFNYDFWRDCSPRRSTWIACRAVIAARQQGDRYDEIMTRAIQHAYYLQARNPSDRDTLVDLAAELQLDIDRFEQDLSSTSTEATLQHEMQLSESMGVASYPDLRLAIGEKVWPIAIDYNDDTVMLETITALFPEDPKASSQG